MSFITFIQDHYQGILAIGVIVTALALHKVLTRKTKELETLKREYQDIVRSGTPQPQRTFAAKTEAK